MSFQHLVPFTRRYFQVPVALLANLIVYFSLHRGTSCGQAIVVCLCSNMLCVGTSQVIVFITRFLLLETMN